MIGYIGAMKDSYNRTLSEWEFALTAELAELRNKRNEIQRDFERVSRKLELIRQMRALEAPHSPAQPITPFQPSESKATPASVREMAMKILSDHSRPLHISEIHRAFLDRGYPIPGKGTPFNILAHMVNNKSFARISRGTYALRDAVLPEQIMPKAVPRRRKRRLRRKVKGTKPNEIQTGI